MKHKTTTNSLLGKHNVTSNQADWQFGISRFSKALFVSATNKAAANMVPIATTYSLCNLIRQMDRSGKHLKNANLTCIVFPLPLSQSQFDSPALLWPACDNGAPPAICNPPSDPPLWVMHRNHSLTNLLGMPIYKTPEWKSQNTDCNIALTDRTTIICCQKLFFFPCLTVSLFRLNGIFKDISLLITNENKQKMSDK